MMVRLLPLLQIGARDLAPALSWVEEHRPQLALASASSAPDFEFRLHRLRFVQLLTTRGGACSYADLCHGAQSSSPNWQVGTPVSCSVVRLDGPNLGLARVWAIATLLL